MSSKVRIIAAISMIVASCVILLISSFPIPPFSDRSIHKAIGRAMAEQALALSESGGAILVLRPDTTEFPRPAFDLQFDSFRKNLGRGANISVVRTFELDPLRPNEVPPGDYFELLRKAPPKTVIVSLLGPPLLSDEQRKQLGAIRPKIVAFCPGSLPARVDLLALFRQGLLHAAIAAKYPPPNQSAREFNQLYSVLNASNLPKPNL